MNVIHALGLKDTTHLRFPAGLYTTKSMLRGDHPFAVIFNDNGNPKLRVGSNSDSVGLACKIVVD